MLGAPHCIIVKNQTPNGAREARKVLWEDDLYHGGMEGSSSHVPSHGGGIMDSCESALQGCCKAVSCHT